MQGGTQCVLRAVLPMLRAGCRALSAMASGPSHSPDVLQFILGGSESHGWSLASQGDTDLAWPWASHLYRKTDTTSSEMPGIRTLRGHAPWLRVIMQT